MSRVADKDANSRRLIDHVASTAELGPPRALLATTFDLNAEFFELDFLPSLLRLPTMDDRRVRSRIQLEGELAKMDAVAIMMQATRFQGRPKSLRVDVRPAIPATGGVLHAKVTLLVHDEVVRLIVASANLTTSGYRENREVAFVLAANKKNPEAGALIRQVLDGLPARLAPWWSPAAQKVFESAQATLDAIGVPTELEDEAFVWGGGAEPLWQRVLRFWPDGEMVTRISIVSPFWSDESGNGPLAQLVRALRARSALVEGAEVRLVTDPQPETTTGFRPTLPASYGTFDARTLGIEATAIAAKAQVDEEDVGRDDLRMERRLHAKVLLLEGSRVSVAYAGSANFTIPGWGFGNASAANVEAGIVLRRRGKSRSALAELIPPAVGAAVTLDGAATGAIHASRPDDDAQAFPTFLRGCELRPSASPRKLDLVLELFVDRAPDSWSIALGPDEEPLLEVSGQPHPEYRVDLAPEQLGQVLRRQVAHVRWTTEAGEHRAQYPVNVTLDARQELPFGDPEAFPGENELVAFYQGRIAWEDVFPVPKDEESENFDGDTAIDSQVDTSKILSYQVRAFVEALQGLRDELRSSVATQATMRLALLGPVSPTALARSIHMAVVRDGRSPTAGAFQLVELLACTREASSFEVHAPLRDAWAAICDEASLEISRLLDEVRARDPKRLGSTTTFDTYAVAITPTQQPKGDR